MQQNNNCEGGMSQSLAGVMAPTDLKGSSMHLCKEKKTQNQNQKQHYCLAFSATVFLPHPWFDTLSIYVLCHHQLLTIMQGPNLSTLKSFFKLVFVVLV